MILLRPRPIFRTQKATRGLVLKISRAERRANLEARERLVGGLQPVYHDLFRTYRLNVEDGLMRELGEHSRLQVSANAIDSFDRDMRFALEDSMLQAIDAGGDIGIRHTGVEGISVDGELATQRARSWIRSTGGQRITNITAANRRAINNSVARALGSGLSPTAAAQRISREVGLTEQQASSLRNFEEGLIRRRIPSPEADTQFVRETIAQDVERARDRMIDQRSRRILETESQFAIQEGERQFYEQAAAQGEIELEAMEKRWFTVRDDRVCEICEPLHGKVVGFRDDFSSLSFNGAAPPAHPSCRCFLEYKPTGDFTDDESPSAPSGAGRAAAAGIGAAAIAGLGAAAALGFFGQPSIPSPLSRVRPVRRPPLRINLAPGRSRLDVAARRRFGDY